MQARLRSNRNSYFLLVGMKNGTLGRIVWQYVTDLTIVLQHDPAITLFRLSCKLMSTQKYV